MTARTDIQRVSGTSRPSDKLNGEETMKNANQTTIAAAGITSTRFEVADRSFSCKSYYDANGRLIAEVGSYGGDGYVQEETGRREYRVTHQCDGDMAESFFSRAAAVRRADERVAAWIKTETETETETCSDCGGTALRLDTTTGAIDCVDCGNETETETETPSRPYFQDLDRDADLSGFLVVEPKADGCFGLLTPDGTVTSRNDTTLGRIDLKTDEDFVLVGEYLIRTPWSVETGRTGTFLAFDILVDRGEDVSGLPLVERKRRMARVVRSLGPAVDALPWYLLCSPSDRGIIYRTVDDTWREFVTGRGWEGLVFKSAGAYGEGWGRMKRVHERDFILVDFEDPKVESHVGHLVGSAVIGHYVDDALVIVGRVSAGFDHEMRREMFLDPSAFIGRVMKVRGNSVFKSGAMRHPVFNGWHADKSAEDCSSC